MSHIINKPSRRSSKMRLYILVAELKSHDVKKIVDCGEEKKINKEQDIRDKVIFQKARVLVKEFPANLYDICLVRTPNTDTLKEAYPEFSEWERITPEILSENV